jgi:hypothetical protein
MSTTRIVVGVDGSSESKTALDWAIDLARDTDAGVLAVHATETRCPRWFPPTRARATTKCGGGSSRSCGTTGVRRSPSQAFPRRW